MIINALTIDVEEYFHPSEVQRALPSCEWGSLPSRVESSTRLLLDILKARGAFATVFVLGWVARQHPGLIREIHSAGHEIACHSQNHRLVYEMTPREFKKDTLEAIASIHDSCGVTARIYRAPSYSVTKASLWALDILAECGFTHDSSIYPVAHDRYGIPGFGRHAQQIRTPSGMITEVPPATVALSASRIAPVGGGGYLRLLPYRYTAAGIRRVNALEQQPACIYMHPWEFDPDQPRLTRGVVSRIRTYSGMRGMERKLQRLLREFSFSTFTSVYGSAPIAKRKANEELGLVSN